MKVAYVMDAGVPDVRHPAPSGPARHVRSVIRALRGLGHDVRLVARLDGDIWMSDDLEQFQRLTATAVEAGPWRLAERVVRRTQRHLRLPYVGYFDSRRFAAVCGRVLTGYDVMYERMGWMGLGGSLAARRLGIPHVLEVNGDHLFELDSQHMTPGPVQRRLSMRLMRQVARNAAWTIAAGSGWRERHISRWGVDPSTVSVVPNGTDVVDALGRRELRCFAPAGRVAGPLRVIFAGSFDAWQGLPHIIRAVARARATGADVVLTLAGSGRLEPDLRNLVASLDLGTVVTFVGHLPMAGLVACLRRSDVGVAAYRARGEYAGLKLLDYKAAGLAVVTTGRDGQPAEVTDGLTGLVVPENDEAALGAALARCAGERDFVRRLGAAGRSEAETRHRWQQAADQISQRLEPLVATPRHVVRPASAPATARATPDISTRRG
jgi:glycosyltransferase involved in cell wall biosynthesis